MRTLLILLTLLNPGLAHALSCLRPDAVRMFEQARQSKAAFYLVRGEVMFLEAPNVPARGAKTPTTTRAQISGSALTSAGFQAPFQRDVMIETSCLGPWCGDLDGLVGDLIMAIEITGPDTLVLNVGPCGGDAIPWDTSGEERLMACFLEGTCVTADF
ncbi:MAG: hypothetical protein AAFY31_15845 [Pseudomonadota bacterium]